MFNWFKKNPFGLFQFGKGGEIYIDRGSHDNLMRSLMGEETSQRHQAITRARKELRLMQEIARIEEEKQRILDKDRERRLAKAIDDAPPGELKYVLEAFGEYKPLIPKQ